jgi:hypothetical protein
MPVLLALQDLFVSDLLPDRKLLFFRENALRQPPDVEQEALFQFEHALKLAYASHAFLHCIFVTFGQVRVLHQITGVCSARPRGAHKTGGHPHRTRLAEGKA